MTKRGFYIRLAICIVVDLLDATIGRLPMTGSLGEGFTVPIMYLLWGPIGLAYGWELVDVLDQLDGFVPTATLIALFVGWRQGLIFGRKKPTDIEPKT